MVIKLSGNKFNGTIPSYFCGKFKYLYEIDFSQNKFSGPIPDLSNCVILEKLLLSNNLLSGSIPLYFAQLSQLNTIQLANNQMTGAIPKETFCAPALTQLDLT